MEKTSADVTYDVFNSLANKHYFDRRGDIIFFTNTQREDWKAVLDSKKNEEIIEMQIYSSCFVPPSTLKRGLAGQNFSK